jgi:hypothetical protein
VTAPGSDGSTIAWIESERFEGGRAGPVAVIRVDDGTAKVHALGWLHAPATDFRMESVGDWLVIHGQSTVQLLRRHRGELRELALEESGSDCVAPARFALREQGSRAIDDYVRREFAIERTLNFIGEVPVIHEHLTVRDIDPRYAAPEPDKLVHEAERDRPLLVDGHVLLTRPSLWAEAIEDEVELEPVQARIPRR